MPEGATILEILGGKDDAVAISATDRPDLTYKDLRDQIDRTVEALNDFGIGRNDRVAIVLPNGSEMAVAYLSVAMAATTAPLNPAYRVDEYAFYMEDLSAKALLVEAGSSSPAVEAAETLNVPILEVTTDDQRPAGSFDLTARTKLSGIPEAGGLAQADDVALVLHTSGTTSRRWRPWWGGS